MVDRFLDGFGRLDGLLYVGRYLGKVRAGYGRSVYGSMSIDGYARGCDRDLGEQYRVCLRAKAGPGGAHGRRGGHGDDHAETPKRRRSLVARSAMSGLAPRSAMSGLAPRSAMSGLAPRSAMSGLAPRSAMSGLAPRSAMSGLAPRSAMSGLAPRSAMSGLAPRSAMSGLAPRSAMSGLAPRSAMSGLAPQRRSRVVRLGNRAERRGSSDGRWFGVDT